MKFFNERLEGVWLIEREPFIDNRGAFSRHFCIREYSEHGIVSDVRQANLSENRYAYTLRGFHYQIAPYGEAKTLSCVRGRVYDVVVDLRKESSTYMKWTAVELSDENRYSIHLPPGCANAFLTLEENCVVHYYCSQMYSPGAERGIRYNDPEFNFKWPHEPVVISEKDRKHPDYLRTV